MGMRLSLWKSEVSRMSRGPPITAWRSLLVKVSSSGDANGFLLLKSRQVPCKLHKARSDRLRKGVLRSSSPHLSYYKSLSFSRGSSVSLGFLLRPRPEGSDRAEKSITPKLRKNIKDRLFGPVPSENRKQVQ